MRGLDLIFDRSDCFIAVLRTRHGPVPLCDAGVHDLREALRLSLEEMDRRDARTERALEEARYWRRAAVLKQRRLSLVGRLRDHMRFRRFLRDFAPGGPLGLTG